MSNETIVAIATPPGRGGVGIIRLSGSIALAIAYRITGVESFTPRQARYVCFYRHDKALLDQGLVCFFKAPMSFTGEDVIELHAHGSPIVLDELVAACIQLGARIAKPGEFSERAFLNGKIDLTQAEAIADLINASSETAARMAVKSLQGDFSMQVNALNEQLIRLRLYVEAAIDFPEEEIDFLQDGKIHAALQAIIAELGVLRATANQGTILREGLSLVITGLPNAGKSTLINTLSGRDVAIVTAIAGTTRDVMREFVLLDDIPIHLIDTAGLRTSNDLIEQEGIKRAWKEVHRADCVLLLIDVNYPEETQQLHRDIAAALPSSVPLIRVYNKIDTAKRSAHSDENGVYVSAKSGEGLDLLKAKIKNAVGYQPVEGQFLARRRHLDALDKTLRLLTTGRQQLVEHRAGELLAEDLRLAHRTLGEITGEFSSDDLLGKIFSSFCIGK